MHQSLWITIFHKIHRVEFSSRHLICKSHIKCIFIQLGTYISYWPSVSTFQIQQHNSRGSNITILKRQWPSEKSLCGKSGTLCTLWNLFLLNQEIGRDLETENQNNFIVQNSKQLGFNDWKKLYSWIFLIKDQKWELKLKN